MDLVTVAPEDPGPEGDSLIESLLVDEVQRAWLTGLPGWADPGWWSMPVRREAAGLLELPAGLDLIAALQGLPEAQVCPAGHEREGPPGLPVPGSSPGFPCGCQLVVAAAWQAAAGWASVRAAAALVGAAGQEPAVLPAGPCRPRIEDPSREEVAMALRVSPRSAAGIIGSARDLMAHPEAAALAAEGVVPATAVRRVCADLALLDPRDATDVIQEWGQRVRRRLTSGRGPMTGQGARRSATRLMMAAPSFRRVRQRARAGRRVELHGSGDGTSTVTAVLREEDALRVHRRLTALARGLDTPGDTRCLDAKRADLLVDILLGRRQSGAIGVEVNVIIPVNALLGAGTGLAEIPGVGPIPADVARELAADARWRAWFSGSDGRVVATSASTYRPGESLARLVRAREPECRMPGCTTPADRCDLDHAIPFPKGPTTAANLGPLCRRHHILKTHAGYDLIPDSQVWRTPAGAQASYAVG